MKPLNIIKYLFLLSIILISFSCLKTDNYTYKWKVAVVYTNGEKDTIDCQYDSFHGNNCYLTLKISESGTFSSGGTEPCIIVGCGFYSTAITCGVRKYKILSLNKVLLK